MTWRGLVKNHVVVFDNDSAPPDGTVVEVTSIDERAEASSGLPATPRSYAVSEEQRQALLRLIGLWKVQNAPTDADVERIIDEARTKKYG